jgi:hypothetical protein
VSETTLTYNGVTLRNCLTRTFRQEAVYDRSDTDLLYYRYTIGVTGYLSSADVLDFTAPTTRVGVRTSGLNPSLPPPAGSAINAPTQHLIIRAKLMEPRQAFEFKSGTTMMLEANPVASKTSLSYSNVDVKNGPHPRSLAVTQIVSSNVMRLEFEIEVCLVECNESGTAPNQTTGILNNRWSMVDVVDQDYYTTRTINGRMETADGTVNVNSLRFWVVPRLQPGFRRQSMQFTVNEDARILDYTIVDREVAFACPAPATSWDVRHVEKTSNSRMVQSSLDVTLKGPRDADKQAMIRIGVALIEAKISKLSQLVNNGGNQAQAVIHEFTIVDSFGDSGNSIQVSCLAERAMETNALLGALTNSIGRPITAADLAAVVPGYNSNFSVGARPGDPIYVSGPIPVTSAWHAYLQTPCDGSTHGIESAENALKEQSPFARIDYALSGAVVSALPTQPVNYVGQDHRDAVYTHWQAESVYQQDAHRIALPIAGQAFALSDDSPTLVVGAVALPGWRRIVRIVGQRVGREPSIPRPVPSYQFGNGRAILLRNVATPVSPERTPGGQEVFTVRAEFEYALTTRPKDTDQLPVAFNPWEDASVATHKTNPQNFFSNANP